MGLLVSFFLFRGLLGHSLDHLCVMCEGVWFGTLIFGLRLRARYRWEIGGCGCVLVLVLVGFVGVGVGGVGGCGWVCVCFG